MKTEKTKKFTVKELLTKLKDYPLDMGVIINGYEGGYNDVCELEVKRIVRDVHEAWYYGPHDEAKKEDKNGEDYLLI